MLGLNTKIAKMMADHSTISTSILSEKRSGVDLLVLFISLSINMVMNT